MSEDPKKTVDFRRELDEALYALDDLEGADCYGELVNGETCPGPGDTPQDAAGRVERCSACNASRAAEAIVRALTPALVPTTPNRMTNPPERIYLELWREQNERIRGVNGGYTLLENLLAPEDAIDPLTGRTRPRDWLKPREAEVATTIVMWLGTNCGQAFMREAERRIEQERKENAALESYRINRPGLWDETDPDKALGQKIADRFIPRDKRTTNAALAGTIAAALAMTRHGKTLADLVGEDV